ncbi:MAG: YcaO-like family protein [bacterium]
MLVYDPPRTAPPPAGSSALPVRRDPAGQLLFGPLPQQPSPCPHCVDARLASNGRNFRHCQPDQIDAGLGAMALARLTADPAKGAVLSFDEKGWQRHLVLPVPGCLCAKHWTPPSDLEPATAVDPLVGLIARLEDWQVPGFAGEPLTLAVSIPCRLTALGGLATIIDGAGFGLRDQARRAATGETIERYCASFVPDGLPVCRARDLGAEHLLPSHVPFGGAAIGADQPVRWVLGHRVIDGVPVWVQASAVYFPYRCHDREPPQSWGGSEGLAAGTDRHAALVHATHEMLERDAFIRAWRFDGPRRPIPTPHGDRGLHLTRIDNRFGIPVVAAFIDGETPPLCSAGIAARATEAEAVTAATHEALGAQALHRRFKADAQLSSEARRNHALDPSLRSARQAWQRQSTAFRGPPPPASWTDLLLRLPDAVAVDVTTPDVRALGLTVLRVVIPGCHGSEPVMGVSRIGGNPLPTPF